MSALATALLKAVNGFETPAHDHRRLTVSIAGMERLREAHLQWGIHLCFGFSRIERFRDAIIMKLTMASRREAVC